MYDTSMDQTEIRRLWKKARLQVQSKLLLVCLSVMPSPIPHLRQWPTIQSQRQSPLFADGCLLNRNIKTDQDAASLQYDLNNLQE